MTDCLMGVAASMESGAIGGLDAEASSGDRAPGFSFGRLVRLVRDNERLLTELEQVQGKVQRAWNHLSEPGSNAGLALAQLERLRLKRSALLAHLRANRVEARTLLGGSPPDLSPIALN